MPIVVPAQAVINWKGTQRQSHSQNDARHYNEEIA